jgi:hypothetical protein
MLFKPTPAEQGVIFISDQKAARKIGPLMTFYCCSPGNRFTMMQLKRAISAIIINAKKNAAIPMKTVIRIEDVTRVIDKAMIADIRVPIIPASRQTLFLLIQILRIPGMDTAER